MTLRLSRLLRALAAAAAITLIGLPQAAPAADHGHAGDVDTRHAIALDAGEKHFLLSEMREFLAVIQRILTAGGAGDMEAVAKAASSVGLKAHQADFAEPASLVHGIRRKAPKEFFPLGRATHAAFDEIADVARSIGDKDTINRMLAENLQRCVACHATYRVTDTH